jgi:hypothetical protein
MAKTILTSAYFACGAGPTDLSDHVRSITIDLKTDIVDATCMTDAYKDKLAGMTDWSVDVEFAQDYAAGEVDATLFPLIGTSVPLVIKPTQSPAGPGNPIFTGTGIMESYSPLSGKVSDLNTNKVKFQGTANLARSITTT